MIVFGLSPDQAQDLADHLVTVVSGDALYDAVAAVDLAFFRGRHRAVSRVDNATKKHLRAVVKHATGLLFLLNDEGRRPRLGTGCLDFDTLQSTLALLAASARAESKVDGGRPRGRPSMAWRDELIATIAAIYPDVTPDKTVAATAEMLLEWLDAKVEDVVGAVQDARRRRPAPHTRVRCSRPITPGFQAATVDDLNARIAVIEARLGEPPEETPGKGEIH
jgi:hypothetical protein